MSKKNFRKIVVVKFGGSVLEDERGITRAADIVRSGVDGGTATVVVVSALKGVTDSLIEISKQVRPDMDPSLLDELLSSGEKTSARLVAAALATRGLDPVVVDPDSEYWPIITDERHQDANPLLDQTRERVESHIAPLLRQGRVPVVCGFLGRTLDGRTTTLGRGGSDTTAVILGSCLNAKEVVLIKDVEGVFSSDPDRVDNPHFIKNLDGEEAELLAAGGAKFLHSKALRYKSNGLRIRVTNLAHLNSGTIIEGDLPDLQVELSKANVSMVTVVGVDPDKIESVTEVVRSIRESGGSTLALSLERRSAILYITGGGNVLDLVHGSLVHRGFGKAVSIFEGLSMITVRGKSLETHPGLVQRVTQPLARQGINLFGIVTILSSIRVFVSSDQARGATGLIREAMMVSEK